MFRLFLISASLSVMVFLPCLFAQSTDAHIEPRVQMDGRSRSGNDISVTTGQELQSSRVRVHVDLVLVPVTVTTTNNQPVTNLHEPSFEVYENDEPQEIRHFYLEDSPISVGLLLDVSRSMRNKIEIEKDAVREFFSNANPQDDYFAITFASRPRLLANPSQSVGTLESRLGDVNPNGNTALLDAVSMGVSMLKTARYRRRALLIISDGGDNNSRFRLNDVKSLVQESDVMVYAIGIADQFNLPLFKSLDERARKRCLDEITEASGGRTIMVNNLARVPDAAARISREMRTQYVIGYKPSNHMHDGTWRRIKVRVASNTPERPLQAFYKRGYVSPQP
jgi:Ca-activated chloride channel homolog